MTSSHPERQGPRVPLSVDTSNIHKGPQQDRRGEHEGAMPTIYEQIVFPQRLVSHGDQPTGKGEVSHMDLLRGYNAASLRELSKRIPQTMNDQIVQHAEEPVAHAVGFIFAYYRGKGNEYSIITSHSSNYVHRAVMFSARVLAQVEEYNKREPGEKHISANLDELLRRTSATYEQGKAIQSQEKRP